MRHFVYTVFDTASGMYDRPFVAHSDGVAIRGFGDIAADASHPIGMHPEHYQLYRIGTFDDNTAVLEPEDAVCIGKAHELVAASRKVDGGALWALDKEIANAS